MCVSCHSESARFHDFHYQHQSYHHRIYGDSQTLNAILYDAQCLLYLMHYRFASHCVPTREICPCDIFKINLFD